MANWTRQDCVDFMHEVAALGAFDAVIEKLSSTSVLTRIPVMHSETGVCLFEAPCRKLFKLHDFPKPGNYHITKAISEAEDADMGIVYPVYGFAELPSDVGDGCYPPVFYLSDFMPQAEMTDSEQGVRQKVESVVRRGKKFFSSLGDGDSYESKLKEIANKNGFWEERDIRGLDLLIQTAVKHDLTIHIPRENVNIRRHSSGRLSVIDFD